MAFPMLIKKKLFEQLWERARAGHKAPSLRFIAKAVQLQGEPDAERLLLEMQGDGAISVVKGGAYPWLTLRRNTYTGPLIAGVWLDPEKMERETLVPEEADAPSPAIQLREEVERRLPAEMEEYRGASGTARKASSAEESTSAKRIPDRAPPPATEAIATPPAPSQVEELQPIETVEPSEKQRHAQPPSSIDQGSADGERPQMGAEEAPKREGRTPQAVEARQPKPGYPRGGRPADPEAAKRKLAVFLSPEDYAYVDALGEAEELFTGRMASQILAEALEGRRCDTGRKHRLSAAVQRAWREDGRPLDVFVTALIDIGLEEYLRFRDQREAA